MMVKQKQALRATAHGLKPVVLFGSKGLTPALIQEIDIALLAHELIKIKLTGVEKDQKQGVLKTLCEELKAVLIQTLGNTAVLYRKNQLPHTH